MLEELQVLLVFRTGFCTDDLRRALIDSSAKLGQQLCLDTAKILPVLFRD
jgi:hypothetical protein